MTNPTSEEKCTCGAKAHLFGCQLYDQGRAVEAPPSKSQRLVERLRSADRNSVQRTLGSRIFGEAADEIERLLGICRYVTAQLDPIVGEGNNKPMEALARSVVREIERLHDLLKDTQHQTSIDYDELADERDQLSAQCVSLMHANKALADMGLNISAERDRLRAALNTILLTTPLNPAARALIADALAGETGARMPDDPEACRVLGDIAFKYIDRMNDETTEDPWAVSVREFLSEANPALEAIWHRRCQQEESGE